MKILLLGASGFIGRHAYSELSAHHEVLAPHRDELNLTASEKVRAYIKAEKPEAIKKSSYWRD